jgi:hypothetical protein
MGLEYNDPQFTIVREVVVPAPVAGAAGNVKFSFFAAVTLTRCQAAVKTAGTSANTGAYLQVLVGTNTLGTLLTGSSVAGSILTSTFTGAGVNVPAGTQIEVLQGTDATNAAHGITFEYQANVV